MTMERGRGRNEAGRALAGAVAAVVIAVLVALALPPSAAATGGSFGLRTVALQTSALSSPEYLVTISETGLPSGTSWSVTLNGSSQTSSNASIEFEEPNGSYLLFVGSVPGYSVGPEWNFTVQGGPANVTVEFVSTTPVPNSCSSIYWRGTNNTLVGNCLGFFDVEYRAYNATTGYATDNSTITVGPLAEVTAAGTVVALGTLGYQGSGMLNIVSTPQEVNVTDTIVGNVTNAIGVNSSTGDPNGQIPQWNPSQAPGGGGSTTWGNGGQVLGSIVVGIVFHFENGSGGAPNRVKFDVTVSSWPWVSSDDTLGLAVETEAYALPEGSHFSYTASNDTIAQLSNSGDAPISSLAFGPTANASGNPPSLLRVIDQVALTPVGPDPTMASALLTFVGPGGYSRLVYDPWILFGVQGPGSTLIPPTLPAGGASLPVVAVGAISAAAAALGVLTYRLRRRPVDEGLSPAS
jgi:hypothetical protein